MLWGCLALRHGAGWAWLRGKMEGIRKWDAVRGNDTIDHKCLDRLLNEGERLILQSQPAESRDWYWKMYFLLAGSGTK